LPSGIGLAYFVAAALIIGFPSVVWAYAAGKAQLVRLSTAAGKAAEYTGRELSLSRKIAIVFIGSFIVAMVSLGLLVSSRVSRALETLAVNAASDRFQRLHDNANVLARVDAAALDAFSALRAATLGGAKAIGFDDQVGSIEPGKQADLVCVDLSALETQPLHHVVSQLIYATGRQQVSDVWIAGRAKLLQRTLVDIDIDGVIANARQWRERIAGIRLS
jgi:hypothetical protein